MNELLKIPTISEIDATDVLSSGRSSSFNKSCANDEELRSFMLNVARNSLNAINEPTTGWVAGVLVYGIEIGMRIMQARFDAVVIADTPQYREGFSAAIDAVRASLRDFPSQGGDSVIMHEVERLIGEAVNAATLAVRERENPWQGVTG